MSSTILIVEDEFIIANSLRVTLQQAGHKVTGIASSSEEAREYLLSAKPDLVLLDIRLNGEQTGIDLARKLKAENIGFIYLSANSNQKVLEEAKVTEPYGFLVKPFRDRDLLVALDIALYRHKNSLESRLRQETILQKALLDISNETSGAEQKLLKIGRAIRSFIPFDLVIFGNRSPQVAGLDDFGYLRVGFDEYQFIGENELLTYSGLNRQMLSNATDNSQAEARAAIYIEDIGMSDTSSTLRQKLWVHRFNIASYVVFPISLSDGSQISYFFCSRQRDFYNQGHLAVLNLFTSCLTNVTEKMLLSGPASIFTSPYPAGKKQVGTENDHASRNLPVFKNIVGNHPLILAALDLVIQVAPYNTSVLIMGESGTGKERVAHSLHLLSPRKAGPYIKVNCAAIPTTLLESELFGHEKGAFTGAVEKRKGKFEQADGGTIFLDEIGELPLDMQVRLLRVLQEKEIDPVGGSRPRKVNIRIVAATNRNLEREVAEGNFRLDLYYRLNVFPIVLPPLRERKSDVAPLALFFAHNFCKEFGKEFSGISDKMMDELLAYQWPGNIRELENVIQRSVILNDSRSQLNLAQSLTRTVADLQGSEDVENLADVKRVQMKTEKAYIISILKKAKGVIRGAGGAAELLDIKPTTLESKIARLGIQKDDYNNPPSGQSGV